MIISRTSLPFLVLFLFCFQSSIAQQSGVRVVGNTGTFSSTSPPPSSTHSSGSSSRSSKHSHSTAKPAKSITSRKDVSTSTTHTSDHTTTHSVSHTQSQQSTATTTTPQAKPQYTHRNGTAHDIDLLPIRPEITPAFGVSGVILMISGLAYTLIGVRKRWLSIFLSSGYLVALAVTVLVLYVMDPPISEAIQGAYVVAAVASGCIIGGLSLIFTEVTEGLGCLLGGFCLAMWFLVLKPGGLVTSVGGRVAMIASFSLASFALAFSKYTRTYGLIVCIAFAGATIVVLGIDCFSRAGLKEFWVYIWNLNSDLFPLGTTTYPMTRGIIVEVAGIILLFLCGLLSQWKLYKILKERKAKKALAREEDDEAREHLEADVGRNIEETAARERAAWERHYGGGAEQGQVSEKTSVAGSTYPISTNSRAQSVKDMTMNVHEVYSADVDAMELKNLAPGVRASRTSLTSKTSENPQMLHVRSVADEVTARAPSSQPGWPLPNNSTALDRIQEADSRTPSMRKSSPQLQGDENTSLRPSASPPPVVVPLPFTVTEQETQSRDDTESLATVGDTAVDDFEKRWKGRSARRSLRAISDVESSDGEEDLFVPHIEDDRASSVAATLDELTDDEGGNSLPPVSRSASPTRRTVRRDSKKVSLRRVGSASDLRQPPSLPDSAVSVIKTQRRLSEPPPTELVEVLFNEPPPKQPEDLSNILDLTTARGSKRKSVESAAQTSHSGSRSGAPASAVVSLSAVKSIKLPSVAAQKFRTHEWTKYLSDAEQPLLGELDPSEDGVRIERYSREAAAPVHVEDLQQTGTGSLNRSGSNPNQPGFVHQQRLSRSVSDNVAYNPNAVQQDQALPGAVNRSFSQPSIMTQGRNFSSPLVSQPLVESPVEDMQGAANGGTLLGIREDMLRKKASARDLHGQTPNFTASTFFPNPVSAFSETSSIRSLARTTRIDPDNISLSSLKQKMDEDNMPLSRRRTLIQQQIQQGQGRQSHRLSGGSNQSQPYLPQAQATWPDPGLHSRPSAQSLIYDAHLPQRGPSVDAYTRQARMATFHESLRNGLGPSSTPAQAAAGSEEHRFAMLTEKRQAQAQLQQREYQKQALDSVVDQNMRNGVMLDLHKERLRRMQSQAGKA